MKKGTQIAYIPRDVDGTPLEHLVEFGFVTSVTAKGAFCRYWSKGADMELRTKANSELTPFESLVEIKTVSQDYVDRIIKELEL